MAMRGIGLGAVMVAAGMLAGCAPPTVPKLDVEAQWSEAINNLGMFAVYPPSEDVMVGDAFLYLPDAVFFDLVRVTAAPLPLLSRQFCYQEQDRMAVDTIEAGTTGVVKPARQPNEDDKCQDVRDQRIATHKGTIKPTGPAGDGHATRLRETAIPILEVGRFSEAEVAGAGLLGNFGGTLGVGTSGRAAARVELKDLSSLTMDELRGSRLLEDISRSRVKKLAGGERDYPNSLTPLMLARSLRHADNRNGTRLLAQFCGGDFEALNRSGARVVVANRVLYAGGVSFEFMSNRVTSVQLAVDFASVLAGMPQKPVVPSGLGAKGKGTTTTTTTTTTTGDEGGGEMTPEEKKKAEEAKKKEDAEKAAEAARRVALDKQLADLLTRLQGLATLDPEKAGQVAGRLATGQFGNLALEKTFHRPAAVGMGAALHFPIGEAAVPAGPGQIDEVMAFCRATHGMASMRTWEQLVENYGWAYFLYRKEHGVAAALKEADEAVNGLRSRAGLETRPFSATRDVAGGRGAPLPPIRMDARVRLRL